ncbi:MAG: septum formation initiator family protein [Marmoricola sp.]
MATRRTPSGPRKGARPGRNPGNIRPRARGSDRAPTPAEPAPRPRFTNRMAILVLVLAVLVVSYASSMRAYLQQRSQMNELSAQIATSTREIKTLEREKRRWQDDAYVETQARERFGWVLPGETSYQVIGRDGKPLERSDKLTNPDSVARRVPTPWWDKVYGTLEAADHPKKAAEPATRITPAPVIKPPPDQ